MDRVQIGKFLCKILRHQPEVIGIRLDEHGWADVDELLPGINREYPVTMEDLEEIVRTDSKQRYSWNEDHTLLRANQGHSIPVDVELPEAEPPEVLYHGTATRFAASIDRTGLDRRSRLYVHLSDNPQTALEVGKRHGQPMVYKVLARKMRTDGFPFYRSVNGVWLTRSVPAGYLEKLTPGK